MLGYFGRWAPLTELREKCEVSRDGSSAASIVRAARHYGLKCSGLSLPSAQLKKLELPLILFWQFHHFLILEGFDDNHFYLNDPSTGRRRLTAEEFERGYSNIALRFERTEDFKPGGKRPGMLKQLSAWRAGSWGVVAGALACGLMLAPVALAVPATISIFVDSVLENTGPWGGLVATLLGAAVLVYVLSLLKHRFLNRLAIRISVVGFQPRLDAAAAPAGGVLPAPAGRRPDRPRHVHRPHREEPDRPASRTHYRHGDERGVSGGNAGLRRPPCADRGRAGDFQRRPGLLRQKRFAPTAATR